jgi:hypothetical protein
MLALACSERAGEQWRCLSEHRERKPGNGDAPQHHRDRKLANERNADRMRKDACNPGAGG